MPALESLSPHEPALSAEFRKEEAKVLVNIILVAAGLCNSSSPAIYDLLKLNMLAFCCKKGRARTSC